MLGDYRFDALSGLRTHRSGAVEPPVRLRDIRCGADGTVRMPRPVATGGEELLAAPPRRRGAILEAAQPPDLDRHVAAVSPEFEHLRWFDLPGDALALS